MSSIIKAIQRVFPVFKPKGLAGYDLQGNRYFERPNPMGGRMRRTIEYRNSKMHFSEYMREDMRPPFQWRAWLSHTRHDPPTVEELQRDLVRQARLLPRVAAIEAREREERIRQGYLLPDGSVPEVAPQIAGPSIKGERKAQAERFVKGTEAPVGGAGARAGQAGQAGQVGRGREGEDRAAEMAYQIPTPTSPGVAPPRQTIDPAKYASPEELRKLAEEDTKRRIAQSQGQKGVDVPGGPGAGGRQVKDEVEGVQFGKGGLEPRRRGKQ
ncbi:hypothetical protein IAT38_002099 [Cryptococcus sp. DSM 104549]